MSTQGASAERAEELLRRSGRPPLQVQPAGEGSHHHLFVVELDDGPLKLLRIPRREHPERAANLLRREAEAVRRARGTVPVAHPAELLPSWERPEGSVTPILPGIRGSDLLRDPAQRPAVGSICQQLGRLLAELHRLRRDIGEPTSIPTLDLPGHEESAPRLLHGDAHLGNLLVERDAKGAWTITGIVDWSFCRWGPPEADLVEMAICEAEPRPRLGRIFYEAYVRAGGLPPREPVLRAALANELERRLREHAQAYESSVRDIWTRWLDQLRRPDALSTRVFDTGRSPGRGLA